MALISVNEAAQSLGVHPVTLRRWIYDGLLPAVRVGRKNIRVDADDVRALIQPVN
jgi:excisionase family DNA binding protein